jgi:hypothetical protein
MCSLRVCYNIESINTKRQVDTAIAAKNKYYYNAVVFTTNTGVNKK